MLPLDDGLIFNSKDLLVVIFDLLRFVGLICAMCLGSEGGGDEETGGIEAEEVDMNRCRRIRSV